ncbi:MAG: nucleotide sugar dehydrogenase [Candidatus Microthrix sp.]|nr:nucleotide sugar dehydrogenase [Candidatus Microthrix sp.]
MNVLLVGQGYVGLPVSMAAVTAGFHVTGFDTDATKADTLASGGSHVEDIAPAIVQAALDSGRYNVVSSPDELGPFDVAVITVPTPLTDGAPDLGAVEAAAAMVGVLLTAGGLVVLESTTWPGTTTEVVAPILEAKSGLRAGVDFHLGYSPERIDPGNKTWRLENTPKVVGGIDQASTDAVAAFYGAFVHTVVPVGSTEVAELTKLLENTFRHVNIALVNELAMFAHDLDIDITDAVTAAATKPFGFMSFRPGPGVGGHCLPIDPTYLSWRVRRRLGTSFRFVELANDVNDHMPDYVVRRVQAGLNDRELPVRGRNVLLCGLAYKADTSDARETPTRAIVAGLLSLGAHVTLADPHVPLEQFPDGVTVVDDEPQAVKQAAASADAVVVLVPHGDFDLDAIVAAAPWVLDCTSAAPDSVNVERL